MELKLVNKFKQLVFGKYDLQTIFNKHKIRKEMLIASQDILYYSEIPITLAFLIVVATLFFSYAVNPIFLVALLISPVMMYFSISLEFVFLTDERIIVEKRTILDKVLSTRSITNIALDQISMIKSGRARPNYPLFYLSSISLIVSGITAILTSDTVVTLIGIYFGVLSLFVLIYSLRIYRRAVTLYVVGNKAPYEIGSRKGISVYWVKKLHETVFERIHHVEHIYSSSRDLYTETDEFPLELNQQLKDILGQLSQTVEKEIYKHLFFEPRTKKQLYDDLKDFDNHLIDYGLSHLSKEGLITYDRSKRVWTITGKVPNS